MIWPLQAFYLAGQINWKSIYRCIGIAAKTFKKMKCSFQSNATQKASSKGVTPERALPVLPSDRGIKSGSFLLDGQRRNAVFHILPFNTSMNTEKRGVTLPDHAMLAGLNAFVSTMA
ncbi:hypothetical protein [Desulfobotulus alkaliphilus]|uniref:hypothetical protein n=1 Tax=Desulfobotulus alkaliphilus TaxID=622671 RepID=UPI001C95E920|nr:hypothetical protein [Desulfobotulus alkaliphilus]